MVDFTIAICTYNGEKRLPAVLDSLRFQIDHETINWEILIVDNNSNDKTAKIVQEYQETWPEAYPIRYYMEPRQGLAFARRCAVQHAKSCLIGFLDDDNFPINNWVATAYRFGTLYPNAGAYGGQIIGKFEEDPPEGFERIARYFALMKGDKPYCYNRQYKTKHYKMFPPGAGIVIRKQAWLASVPSQPILRQTSEDIESLLYIWQAGWQIWFNPEMQLTHLIPKARFEKQYLKEFFRSNGLCRYYVRILNYQFWQLPIVIPIYILNDLRRVIFHWIKYHSVLNNDKVAAGEMELFVSILISPFYIELQRLLLMFRNMYILGNFDD